MSYLSTRPWRHSTSPFPEAFIKWLYPQVLWRFPASIPGEALLIDWGCGTGDFTKEWAKAGFRTKGFDGEPIREAGIEFVNLACYYDDPKLKQTAHVCFCRNVMEHLLDPAPLLRKIDNALVDDGVAVLVVPDWRTYAPIFYDDYTHVRPYTAKSLADLLISEGFKGVHVQEIVQYPPCLKIPYLRWLADVAEKVLPLRFAQWIGKVTGIEFFEWCCLRTVVAICRKG